MAFVLQRIAHPNVITNALICAPDLVVLVKGNSAFESLKFDRQTGEFSISSETAEYSMPCQFSEGIRGLKDECESSNCTILAVTNDRSLLAIIRLERGQTNILKTIPFPVVPSRTGSETPVLIAVDPLNRAFLVAMNGFVQFWLLDANLDVIDTFMLDHSSNLIGNKVIVFAEFMHQSALEPRRKSVMFCLCDKNGQYSAAVVDFSRSDSGKLLMASHDGIMPFPLEIGKPTNLISIPFWQSSCLLITENGCIIIHASDIQANNATVKQFLFPASTRINFIATMPMDERRDAGSGPRFVASAENGDLIMIEISGESGIEISRIACNVLTGALCGLHFIDPHHFFACTDNAIHVFSIGDKYIVNSTQSLDFPGPLNDFVVFPDGNGDRTISIVGSFGYCSLRRLQNGFGPSSENSSSPPEFGGALDLLLAGKFVFVSMISDFTYAFLLENGSLIDFTEKLALCTRTSISIEFVGIFLVQVHRSGILAQQFDVDSMTALREYNWNSPAPVCAASIIGNSRLCVLAMQNGSLQLVKLCIEENGDTIEIKPLYSRPLRAEISCVKLSAVGNSIHCIVGTHEPSISLFRVMYDLDDVFVRLLDVITIPGISSVPHSVDLLTTIGRGITIIAGSRDGSLITGNVNELHLKGRDAVYTEQFGILPVKIVAESECIFAFSGCKAIKMDFVDSQTRITPILTEEKISAAVLVGDNDFFIISEPFLKTLSLSTKRMYDTCICNDVGQFCLIEKFTKSVIVAATKYNQLPSEILVISEESVGITKRVRIDEKITALSRGLFSRLVILGLDIAEHKQLLAAYDILSENFVDSLEIPHSVQHICVLDEKGRFVVASDNVVYIVAIVDDRLEILFKANLRWHVTSLSSYKDILMVGCVKDGVSLFKICFTTKELVFIRGERYSRTADVCLILDANIGISASKNEVYCLSMTQGTKVQYFATVIPGTLKDISAHQCMEEIFRIDLGETVTKIRTLSVSKTLISTESGSLWCLTRVDENTRAQLLIKTQSRILDAVEETYKKSLQMNGFLHRIRGGTHNCIIDAEFICLSSDLIESSHIMRNLFL